MTSSDSTRAVVAVDLGATSGRVIVGHVGPDELRLEQVARFANTPVTAEEENGAGLHWNIRELFDEVVKGLKAAGEVSDNIVSIGVDTWAVDYALMRGGRMIGTPFHYRDERTARGVEAVHEIVPFAELYAQNGLQFLPFNTVYQLMCDKHSGMFDTARSILLLPDLITFWLTGVRAMETTNGSTMGLLTFPLEAEGSGHKRAWRVNTRLLEKLGLPVDLFPRLLAAGTKVETLMPDIIERIGYDCTVTAVGSHDTASAVVAVPMTNPNAAYISCGTWGLVGVELDHHVLTDESREANFTNEGGVDGRTRYLRNVMGLWLLSESQRQWERDGLRLDLTGLLREAAALTDAVPIFDVDDPVFMPPGDMPARIATWCAEHGQPVPHSPAMFARSILESMAEAFAATVRRASELSGKTVEVIHIVGGGSQNELLCQLTADRAGLPVLAGPVEATAMGNVLIQARAAGILKGSLEDLRDLVARTQQLVRYEPEG